MRILQVSSAKNFGGGERHFVDLCRGLASRGHEVFTALRPTCHWQERLSFIPEENILRVSIRNSFGVLSAIRIADFVRENKIDIVHAHVARDYIPASIACLAASDAKFVLTRHVLFPLKPFNRFALKNLAAAIGVSEGVRNSLTGIFPPSKVSVISNGIAITSYSDNDSAALGEEFRTLHDIPQQAPLVGTLGELKELKGQRDFVLAAQEIVKQIPDCRFVITGKDNSADRSFRRELKRLVKVLGLEDSFLWLDWLEDTSPFYAAIDVFVSPSHSESFGLAILEAMLRGKAIVATETEGAKELIGDNEYLVPVKDPVKMSEKVCRLLQDPESRNDYGAQMRKRASENFSLERMVAETESLYHAVLGISRTAAEI
jgi:glycosyltransferase involved in cell wall biosynthesis